MEAKFKHLELIQGIISRQCANSFLLKGWSVVLVSALYALAAQQGNILFAYLAFFPAAIFWGLDGFFIWQERLYRRLYDHVRTLQPDAIDFSMHTSQVLGSAGGLRDWVSGVFSRTLVPFHGAIVITTWLLTRVLA